MADIIQFYPNMLKTYVECPHKFKFKYIEKINLPTKAVFFDKGKKIHALANYYLKGQDISKLQEALTYEEKEIFEILKNNEYFQKTYINSEYNLSCNIGDFWIAGRLDALVKSENNYYILDYKTGSVPQNPKYDFQTMVYLLMGNKMLSQGISESGQGSNPFNLSFVYIDLKNKQNVEIKLDENLKLEYEKIVLQTYLNIQKNVTFNCKRTDKCVFCEYSRLCL